jgi:hypothetical protein
LEVLTPKNRYSKLKNDEGLDLKQSPSQTYSTCKRERSWESEKSLQATAVYSPPWITFWAQKLFPTSTNPREEEKRIEKNKKDEGLTVFVLERPLCAMLPTRNLSPLMPWLPRFKGWWEKGEEQETSEKMVEIFVVERRKCAAVCVCACLVSKTK